MQESIGWSAVSGKIERGKALIWPVMVSAMLRALSNPDNGFLCWQREERRKGSRGFDGVELISG